MKIVVGDTITVLSGKDKGKEGRVMKVFPKSNKVLVEGINKVKKHIKPGTVSKEGGIVKIEKPIDVSNVMYIDAKLGKPTRIGYMIVEGKKYRFSKKSKEVITRK